MMDSATEYAMYKCGAGCSQATQLEQDAIFKRSRTKFIVMFGGAIETMADSYNDALRYYNELIATDLEGVEVELIESVVLKSSETHTFKPPWIEFPEYTPNCMGFRMGVGEDYIGKWWLFWNSLGEEAKNAFKARFSPPCGWESYYT